MKKTLGIVRTDNRRGAQSKAKSAKKVPFKDSSNKFDNSMTSSYGYFKDNTHLREKHQQHVAFSPVDIIHEVNEDVNSSCQSNGSPRGGVKHDLRPTQSQAIHILISQNDQEPRSPGQQQM